MKSIIKFVPSVLFASLMLFGCASQVSGAEPSQETSDKSQPSSFFKDLKIAFKVEQSEMRNPGERYKRANPLTMTVFLMIGGVLALYVRFLYRHCNASVSNADSVARIFPLLTMVTVGVFSIVSGSIALAFGLLGALSIIRFRAAIKDPEELVYLFLCIGIGLALGAEEPLLAIALVVVATLFIVGIHLTTGQSRSQNLLLTITGDANQHFGADGSGVMTVVEQLAGRYTLQRFDLEQDRGQVRIVINQKGGQETVALIEQLRARLPGCEFSYVNLESSL